jgi:ankyrin repeat protein
MNHKKQMKTHKYKKIKRAAQNHALSGFRLNAQQLADISGPEGITGLHLAAIYGCLDQIVGGATAAQLEDCLNDWRTSALFMAAAHGHLDQVEGGVTADDLANTKQMANFAIGIISGTAGEFASMSEEEHMARLQASAKNCPSRDIPQRTGLHWAASHGQLGLIFGGVTAEQLASVCDAEGETPLHWAAQFGHLDQILGGATFEQLISVRDKEGGTPLAYAAHYCALDQIKGGVTAGQLASVRGHYGATALHAATSYVHIRGGVTAEQLINTVAKDGVSALLTAAVAALLNQVTGGVTAGQLAAVVVPGGDGDTGLHLAAHFCALDQIAGGASIQQLHSVKNRSGQTPLEIAVNSRQLFELIGDDPMAYWQALQPAEQEMLRQVLANHQVPAKIVNIVGSGSAVPVIDFQPDGTATLLDLAADN